MRPRRHAARGAPASSYTDLTFSTRFGLQHTLGVVRRRVPCLDVRISISGSLDVADKIVGLDEAYYDVRFCWMETFRGLATSYRLNA